MVIRKKIFMERSGQTLEQVAWRSVGVAIPGSILESSLRGGCGSIAAHPQMPEMFIPISFMITGALGFLLKL